MQGTRALDLVLLHSPYCWPYHCTLEQESQPWQAAWLTLESLKTAGLVANIGVSNFDLAQLQQLQGLSNTRVAAVQNWCDPFHQDRWVRSLAARSGMVYMAYSSLGTQWLGKTGGSNPVLESPVLRGIGAEHGGASVSEVVLCWLLQEGVVAIPRSGSAAHIAANSLGRLYEDSAKPESVESGGAYRCFLTEENLATIRALDGTLGTPWE